ncbi:hypothetical protein E2C01_097142 [Portunus trituberculatus]|uniref:Uncharacterized protein n=1 Tax=Portunus trituberculatus TaxID=210409 RepID=A0A5B7K8S9_PORTR|nr:hypothetical protein [Portunus trituberculatus]
MGSKVVGTDLGGNANGQGQSSCATDKMVEDSLVGWYTSSTTCSTQTWYSRSPSRLLQGDKSSLPCHEAAEI